MADLTMPVRPQRVADWQEALAALVVQRLNSRFVWGHTDCVIFAADAMLAITGEDPLDTMRGQWTDLSTAGRAIAAVGGFEQALQDRGFARIEPLFAQRGDVVVYAGDGGPALAVCMGDSLVAPGEFGLQRMSMLRGESAWRK